MKVNGNIILETDNQHLSYRADVTKELKKGSDNELEIIFESARLEAIKIKEQYPNHKWHCWNGDCARLAVRKAQYHW